MCPCAWGALNPNKTSISRHMQNVQHRWAWGGRRWEGTLGVIGDAWLRGHAGSRRAGSTSYPSAIDVYNTLPLWAVRHPCACRLLSPCGSRMRAQTFGVLFPAGKKVLAQEVFWLQPLHLSCYTFLLLAVRPSSLSLHASRLPRVTAPSSPSSPPLWQPCGILFIRCRSRALNYSDQLLIGENMHQRQVCSKVPAFLSSPLRFCCGSDLHWCCLRGCRLCGGTCFCQKGSHPWGYISLDSRTLTVFC